MADLSTPVCCACLKPLSERERYFYETRCEPCERAWFQRIEAWRHGGADAELDAEFSQPHPKEC